MRTHYESYAKAGHSACGFAVRSLTDDPSRVDCARCRRSEAYRSAVGDSLPPMPVAVAAASIRKQVKRQIRYSPATTAEIAKAVGRCDRQVRNILRNIGAIAFRSPINGNLRLWKAPKGGFECR